MLQTYHRYMPLYMLSMCSFLLLLLVLLFLQYCFCVFFFFFLSRFMFRVDENKVRARRKQKKRRAIHLYAMPETSLNFLFNRYIFLLLLFHWAFVYFIFPIYQFFPIGVDVLLSHCFFSSSFASPYLWLAFFILWTSSKKLQHTESMYSFLNGKMHSSRWF